MSYYSTQIRDSLGREIRVSKEPAPLLQNAGLIFSQYWLSKCHFFDDLFACFGDCLQTVRSPKSSRANVYSNKDLIKQRFYALMAGYEDLNDHDFLAVDAGFRAAVGNVLASCSTLCRFEREIPEELLDRGNEFLRNFFLRHGPRKKVLIIDVDNTPVETHGLQGGRKFNAHYDCNCYLPLLAFIEGYPIGVYNGTIDGRKRMLEVLRPLVESIRAERPNTVILLRADSGFSNTALIDLCNELGIYYLIGLAKNKALIKRLENWDPEFIKVLRQPESIGDVLSHIGEIRDYKAQSWTGPRRVIVRDFWNDVRREWDVRFIQTNIPDMNDGTCADLWKKSSEELYNLLYCQRGLAEQYNQEFKVQAFGKRVSSTRQTTNSYRMLLAALCQAAFRFLRTKFFRKGTQWHTATLTKFRRECIQVPAIAIKSTRRHLTLAFDRAALSSSCLTRMLCLER